MRDVCCPLFLLLLLLLLLMRKWTRAKKRAERTRGPRVHDRRGNGDRDRSPSVGARKSLDPPGWNPRNKKSENETGGNNCFVFCPNQSIIRAAQLFLPNRSIFLLESLEFSSFRSSRVIAFGSPHARSLELKRWHSYRPPLSPLVHFVYTYTYYIYIYIHTHTHTQTQTRIHTHTHRSLSTSSYFSTSPKSETVSEELIRRKKQTEACKYCQA